MNISIITICYNPGEVIRCAVESVLSQSHADVEYIIVDGGSTDGTVEWLSRIQARASHIHFISERDNGLYDALNKGVRRATGDVIGFVHADDFLAHADVLKHVAEKFEDPDVEAVYGDLQYVVEKSGGPEVLKSGSGKVGVSRSLEVGKSGSRFSVVRHWRSGEYSRNKLAWGWMPPHPTLYLKREVYARAAMGNGDYFDASFSCAADYDFMMRVLSQLNVSPVYLPEVMVRMRTGGVSNRSLKHILRKSLEDWQAIRRNRVGHLHTLAWKNLSKLVQFLPRNGKN